MEKGEIHRTIIRPWDRGPKLYKEPNLDKRSSRERHLTKVSGPRGITYEKWAHGLSGVGHHHIIIIGHGKIKMGKVRNAGKNGRCV